MFVKKLPREEMHYVRKKNLLHSQIQDSSNWWRGFSSIAIPATEKKNINPLHWPINLSHKH